MRAGKALRVGTDVADILADWWSETEHTLVKCSIDQVRRFGIALENIAEILNRRDALPRTTSKTPETPRDPKILEAEAEVERLLRAGVEVPREVARLVERLRFHGDPGAEIIIKRWQDIVRCENLVSLIAYQTDFGIDRYSDYLAGLSHLRELRLATQTARDISALGKLTGLTTLALHAPRVADISALGRLTDLTKLILQAPEAVDISALGRLTDLTWLSLLANSAEDISALKNLTRLTSLNLEINNVKDISPLENLTGLMSLALESSRTEDISALERLTNLTRLSLTTRNAKDISSLGGLKGLTSLYLHATEAKDISALQNLTGLTSLTLQASNVRDISALEKLANLTSLALTSRVIPETLARLFNFQHLTKLYLNLAGWDWLRLVDPDSNVENLVLDGGGQLDLALLSGFGRLRTLQIGAIRAINRDALRGVDITILGSEGAAGQKAQMSSDP